MKKILHKFIYLLKKCGYFLFNFFKRIRLRNKDFTIFCNNCIGGCVYHSLGKEFLSPTINCYMTTQNFLKFIENYDSYLKKPLVFRKSESEFPVGMIGEIEIFFNHATSEEEALEEWNRRKNRINSNNLYAIIRELDYTEVISKDAIESLLKVYKNVVIITFDKRKDKLPHYKYIDLKDNKDEFKKNFFGIDLWARKWDYVKFLNKKK